MRAWSLLVAVGVIVLMASQRSDAQTTTVVINELVASNTTVIADGDGDFSDWVELRNTTSSPISLAGWQLNDDAGIMDLPRRCVDPR